MQIKVINTRMHKVPDMILHKGVMSKVEVAEAKLVLVDAPARGHPQMIGTGRLINGLPLAQIPILISETEKIEVGDWYYVPMGKSGNQIQQRKADEIKCIKILALPEHFSLKHLQAIVDGKMKNGDKVLVECEKTEGGWRLDQPNVFISSITKIKLNSQSHMTLYKVESNWETIHEAAYSEWKKVGGLSNFDSWYVNWLEDNYLSPKLK